MSAGRYFAPRPSVTHSCRTNDGNKRVNGPDQEWRGNNNRMGFPLESERMDSIILVTTYPGRARQLSTPSLQALAGVRVVASLLGHSSKKENKTVLVHKHTWNTWAAHPA